MTRILVIFALWMFSTAAFAQTADATHDIDDTMNASEADDGVPEAKRTNWNEYDGDLLTARIGAGFLFDTATYKQDDNSEQQMNLSADGKIRDFRLLLKGRFKFAPRISYTAGYMWDGALNDWRWRQTGFMVDVPEWSGNFFIGRTKEGFSTSKIMVGYYGWTNERAAINDAFLPILADGIKWLGTGFGNKLVYSLGYFDETITPYESYDKNDRIATARAVWLPFVDDMDKGVLHLSVGARYATAKDGTLQYRSKPESFPAQSYAIDTGQFAAKDSMIESVEAYYRPGSLMGGMEYFFNKVNAPTVGDPFFHGGEIFVSYLFTGEEHPYNKRGAYFEGVTPFRPVTKDGPGAWEFVLHYSIADLDSKGISGGNFWRITPMVNWYLTDIMRFEVVYGYSKLSRFGIDGQTQYFQTRLSLTFM